MTDEIRQCFPALDSNRFAVTSVKTISYNCIAWAVGENDRVWWPVDNPDAYWPPGVPREATVESFERAFYSVRFVDCADGKLEPGFEKVALYAKRTPRGVRPSHAARQRMDGSWTSKLGIREDIRHDPKGLEGREYGRIIRWMKRPVASR